MKNKWIAIVSILAICVMGLYLAAFAEDAGKKADTDQQETSQIQAHKGRMGKGPGMGMGKGMGMGMGKMKAEMLEKVKINIVHEDNAVVIKMVSDDPETIKSLKERYAAAEDVKGPAAMRLLMPMGQGEGVCSPEMCKKCGKCAGSEECQKACGAACGAKKEGAACSAAKPAEEAK